MLVKESAKTTSLSTLHSDFLMVPKHLPTGAWGPLEPRKNTPVSKKYFHPTAGPHPMWLPPKAAGAAGDSYF